MTDCKYCKTPITWTKRGEKSVPLNIDGTDHRCKDGANIPAKGTVPTQIGKLVLYEGNQAKLLKHDGKEHSYAISGDIVKAWQSAGHLLPVENHPDVWLEFSVDENGFIRPGSKVVQAPAWEKELSDPTKGEVKKPFTTGKEILQQNLNEKKAQPTEQEKPKETPSVPPQEAPQPTIEEIIRASIKMQVPSERVGYRISLAGMVNSVIEMEKMSSDAPKTYSELEADVKRKALSLFVWCDGMTTQNIKG